MSLEEYSFQLDQVNDALSKDENNMELKKLHNDLKELIELLQQEKTLKGQEPVKKDKKKVIISALMFGSCVVTSMAGG